MKIQVQTAILFTILAAAVILLLNAVIYYAAGRDTSNDFRKRLELRVVVSAKINLEDDASSSALFNQLSQEYLDTLPEEKQYLIPVNIAKDSIVLPRELSMLREEVKNLKWEEATVFHSDRSVYYAGMFYHGKEKEFLVIKSARNVYGMEALKNLRRIMFFGFVGKVLLVFFVSFYFSRKAFKPFRDIISRVRSIGVQNLSLRLQEKKGKDEIAELTNTFNSMLDRLETAFDIQNNFVSNASHELKTPLTTIIGEAEIVLSKQRTPEEYEQALQVILKQAEKLEALTTALLSLAQSGFNQNKENLEKVRIDELLFEIKETIGRIDPEGIIRLVLQDMPADEDKLEVKGNPQLLKLAISNIILNACKYSNHREVTVRLSFPDDREIVISVADQGIGIPDSELKHVFVPFFRASNTSSFKGYGVGLPLALNIIRQHGGNIRVLSTEGQGTTVTVNLPLLETH